VTEQHTGRHEAARIVKEETEHWLDGALGGADYAGYRTFGLSTLRAYGHVKRTPTRELPWYWRLYLRFIA
jgi:hypothetical protein